MRSHSYRLLKLFSRFDFQPPTRFKHFIFPLLSVPKSLPFLLLTVFVELLNFLALPSTPYRHHISLSLIITSLTIGIQVRQLTGAG